MGEASDDRDEVLLMAGEPHAEIEGIPTFGERPRLPAKLCKELCESDFPVHSDQRVLLRHLALLEQVLHEADEARIVLRDPGLRRELDRLVVPSVDEDAEPALEIQDRVERDHEADVRDVRPPPPLAPGDLSQRGLMEARLQK